MNFTYYYLGYLNGGNVVKLNINQQAHVALLNTTKLSRYTHKQPFRHYGELQIFPNEQYKIPFYDEWHLVIYCNDSLKSSFNIQ